MKVLKAAMALKKKKTPKKVTLNYKVEPAEAKEIRLKAEKWTKGNLTLLHRVALQKFKPRARDFMNVK
jgi:hypothetical protein